MKFLDLFGKTQTHPVRHVRVHPHRGSSPESSAEQRHATTRKIDSIESEIASEIASEIESGPPSVPPADNGTPDEAASAGLLDPVSLLRQRIEEACLLHASGQSRAAAALLAEATAVPVHGDARGEQQAWLMQLELAGFADSQARFEDIALGYARRYETSPPQWRGPQATEDAGQAPPHSLSFRGRLCGSAAPALARLEQLANGHPRLCIDLAGVTDVDTEGSRLLVEMLQRWRTDGRHVVLAGIDDLLGLLRLQVSAGRRDSDDAAWLLLIELLGAAGKVQAHEEACLAYSLTYEVSPPVAPAARAPAAGPTGGLLLPAEIRLPLEALIESVGRAARDESVIVLDCRRLQRIEFGAAAPMLAGILRVAKGKPVEWRDVPFLVSTLLQLVSGDGSLRLINRKP